MEHQSVEAESSRSIKARTLGGISTDLSPLQGVSAHNPSEVMIDAADSTLRQAGRSVPWQVDPAQVRQSDWSNVRNARSPCRGVSSMAPRFSIEDIADFTSRCIHTNRYRRSHRRRFWGVAWRVGTRFVAHSRWVCEPPTHSACSI